MLQLSAFSKGNGFNVNESKMQMNQCTFECGTFDVVLHLCFVLLNVTNVLPSFITF